MNVAQAVEHLHATADLNHRLKRPVQRHRAGPHLSEKVSDRAVLHDQIGATVRRRADAVKLHHRRVPREQRHRVSFAMQLTRAPLVALRAHHLDSHVAAGQLLVVQEHVREATLAERANPAEPRNLRASHTRDSWAHC